MATSIPSIAVPGLCLGNSSAYISGPGTYVRDSSIYASIAGPVILKSDDKETDPKRKPRKILTVSRSPQTDTRNPTQKQQTKSPLKFNTLPAVDSIVLARVTRVQKRQATVSILMVVDDQNNDLIDTDMRSILSSAPIITTAGTDSTSTSNTADDLRFQAIIRKEDVRAVEKDRVVMEDMFRVGDIVRAYVISVGDQSSYYCSTARNELGVVMARSEGGNMMFPISWKEMRDPISGVGEARKVAKPF
ncbi:3'-5' exoribonuclease CSL4 [Nannizzia gypsea CBS 118893]|uniref:3'-5' exoribonuclease CSL4 n=1 Tax=Arthroderma gypseum (strain ATCC MYA-4604 / CBS 118893) TaxID=535722 RepID=E4V3U4_ARTGP|nr:3'-5' exoribonuclease CSL4 [Nannizzia gypsea CBS 118893]EFR04668.1 3'-5' exoribonuclease CSL4 [Nannizzia gypsea CBS 118893]